LNLANKALIIGAGEDIPDKAPEVSQSIVICADGGLQHAQRWGIMPHLVVGDLDSSTGDVEAWCREHSVEFLRFPVEKDKTDGELAIDAALARGVTHITMVGVWGNRLDHSLANLDLLYRLAQEGITGEILTGNARLMTLTGKLALTSGVGKTVSLIPLSEGCDGVTTKGLYYPLCNASLHKGSTLGISNKTVSESIEIACSTGILLVVVPKK
jgi:thiamine pyrophosphokinase